MKPVFGIDPNSFASETRAMVKPTGFREYDARWQFPQELNLLGAMELGLGLGTMLRSEGIADIVTGHDFRAYSASIKHALALGLVRAGLRVHDIGLALSPMAYFAQFDLDVPAVAMVTASHNDNGWTGVKIGSRRPLTFGPDEMGRLRDIVLGGESTAAPGGVYIPTADVPARYLTDLLAGRAITRKLKVVAACGNGTAGAFAPALLQRLGCGVVPLDTEGDFTFPRYNPNPEDLRMLGAISEKVREVGADLGLAFDGDGDRCGVVDDEGHEIFADKIGLILARDLSRLHPGAKFVVDVKSSGLFATDPVLQANGATIDYWKTGHSYIKRRVCDLGALAGFEKSGHFFFNSPIGRGYDDGLLTAIAVIEMLDRYPPKTMADLYRDLPPSWGSPTMSPHCADERKYGVAAAVVARFQVMAESGQSFTGQPIREINTINGVRITVADGTWGLVRASSNKPELVVVVESPVSAARMREMFKAVDAVLRENDGVGPYNQQLQ